NANGTVFHPEFTVAAGSTGSDHGARVAMDGAGNFVVSYTENGWMRSDIRAAMFFSDGTLNRRLTVASLTFTYQGTRAVAMSPDGGFRPSGSFAMAWQVGTDSAAGTNVALQRYDPTGAPAFVDSLGHSAPLTVSVGHPSRHPSLAMDYQGDMLVAY